MQIFVRNSGGNTITLEVKSYETICTVMKRFKEKEGIPSDLHLRFVYAGKFLEDGCTVADCNILKESTLHLFMSQHTFIPPDRQSRESTLGLAVQKGRGAELSQLTQLNTTSRVNPLPPSKASEQAPLNKLCVCPVPQVNSRQTKRAWPATQTTPCTKQSAPGQLTQLNVTSQANPLPPAKTSEQAPLSTPPAPEQAKRTRHATQITPRKATPIFETSNAEYTQGLASSADHHAMSDTSYDAKLKLFSVHQEKATAALNDLISEMRDRPPPSVLAELEDLKRALATACSNKKELEATISGLTQKNKLFSGQCASYESQILALKAQNKKTEEGLTVAHNKEKDLRAIISELERKNGVFSAQHASYESQITAFESEVKKTKEELMVARSKEKEQEATISKLIHKNKVFRAKCATYESQVIALEVENKTTKEELMNADKKYYARARGAGYAEGLKEGKAKLLKSVDYLHHLTDASMQYFDYGFDSCQKQAEQQGFVGQLNKESARKEAPELKGWESRAIPE